MRSIHQLVKNFKIKDRILHRLLLFIKYWFIFAMALVLAGCSQMVRLDQKLGEGFEKMAAFRDVLEKTWRAQPDYGSLSQLSSIGTSTINDIAKNLTAEQKEKIDLWLVEHGLNRYGDATTTIYASGTPLVNSPAGEVRERFEYVLESHPEIIFETIGREALNL